jgi:hypothetical protein
MNELSVKVAEEIFFKKIKEYNEKYDFNDKIIVFKKKAIYIFFSKARWDYKLIDVDTVNNILSLKV